MEADLRGKVPDKRRGRWTISSGRIAETFIARGGGCGNSGKNQNIHEQRTRYSFREQVYIEGGFIKEPSQNDSRGTTCPVCGVGYLLLSRKPTQSPDRRGDEANLDPKRRGISSIEEQRRPDF